ncbi:MAG: hypothetical protein EXS10_08675 [Phycisphaerales bacterium]|nr:hypothetical protein [Phycisphaerales bacterium]
MSAVLPTKRSLETVAQQLGDVLAQQHELYGSVQRLLIERKDAVCGADLARYSRLAMEEQRALAEVFELDTRRTALATELATRMGLPKGASILEIAAGLPEASRARLETLRALLKQRMEETRHEGSVLRAAAERLAQHMAGVIQTVRSALAQTGVYGRHGRVALGATVSSTIDLRS